MNVGELKKVLEKYPDDMTVLYRLHSDWEFMKEDDITHSQGVPNHIWVMRSHPTMSEQNKAKEQSFLVFPGN